jgi:hypothetical protein
MGLGSDSRREVITHHNSFGIDTAETFTLKEGPQRYFPLNLYRSVHSKV